MRIVFSIWLLVITFSLFAYPPLPEVQTEEEALFVRRIIDFWRDKEYPFAKSQIQAYLKEYPRSPCADHFYGMLGDIAMHQKAYKEALDYYDKVRSQVMRMDVQPKRWHALYQMQFYTQLYQEIAPYSSNLSEEGCFYFAEATFREALALLRYPEGKEQAQTLCQEALPLYTSLQHTQLFGMHAKLAMAEIYRLLERYQEAADLYLELSEEGDNQEVLFHAAAMLAQCNETRAIEIFEKLTREGGSKAPDAAFGWLQLLAKMSKWETISRERELFLSHLDEKHLPIAYFYLGMIAFEEKFYFQALSDLKKSLSNDQSALLALMMCAKETENVEMSEETYAKIKKDYPQDMAEAGLLRATTYQKVGKVGHALALFEELIIAFPESTIAEKAYSEKVRLLMEEKRWQEAHESVLTFLERYSHSKKEMIRLAIDLSLMQLAEGEVYAQLAEDIERGLASTIFEGEERREKKELLAKSYLKLDRVQTALSLLHEDENPDPFLLAQCYIKEGTSPEKVIAYGEKALARISHKHSSRFGQTVLPDGEESPEGRVQVTLPRDSLKADGETDGQSGRTVCEKYELEGAPEPERLHLHLFNAYLELAKESPDDRLTEKAARHLDAVIDEYPVSLENRLWLAHHLAQQEEEPERVISLFESLLQTEANWKRFDEEALILARLYLHVGRKQEVRPLLEKVISLEQSSRVKAELALADLYKEEEEIEEAVTLYQKLEGSAELPIAYAARLQLARILFTTVPEQSLKKLKKLALRKTLATEPIHLEAALDHAELKASLLPDEQQFEALLGMLLQVKEDFTAQNDIWSKDYHASREVMPKKDRIYQAYIRYLDARIYLLQAKMAKDMTERQAKEKAARALFSTLRQGKYAVSKYLVEKATKGMYQN